MSFQNRDNPPKPPEKMVYYKPTKLMGAIFTLPLVIFLIAAAVSPLSISGRLAVVGGIVVVFIVVMLIVTAIDADTNGAMYERHQRRVKEYKEALEAHKALPAPATKPDEVLPAKR